LKYLLNVMEFLTVCFCFARRRIDIELWRVAYRIAFNPSILLFSRFSFNSYHNSASCTWTIKTYSFLHISLKFLGLIVEENHDTVSVSWTFYLSEKFALCSVL